MKAWDRISMSFPKCFDRSMKEKVLNDDKIMIFTYLLRLRFYFIIFTLYLLTIRNRISFQEITLFF